jgi:hypothetical protein
MSTFYANSIDRLTALLAQNDGAYVGLACNLLVNHFPGHTMSDLRAICERALADGIIAGYGHSVARGTGSNRRIGIAAVGAPALSGFRPGFNTLPDNATFYVALHPDHEGRAVIAKFGRTNDPDARRYGLFPHSQRLLRRDEMFTLDSANATQVEQVLHLAFSLLTVGGKGRQIREYVRAPHFHGGTTRNLGSEARERTMALMVAAAETAADEIAALETIDRHDPAQRLKISNRLVRRLEARFEVRIERTEAGHLSFAR